jgi:hypothetical protein
MGTLVASVVWRSRNMRPFESRTTDEIIAVDFRVDMRQQIQERWHIACQNLIGGRVENLVLEVTKRKDTKR